MNQDFFLNYNKNNENNNNEINIEIIENQKENIQPLSSGRSVKKLNLILNLNQKNHQNQNQNQNQINLNDYFNKFHLKFKFKIQIFNLFNNLKEINNNNFNDKLNFIKENFKIFKNNNNNIDLDINDIDIKLLLNQILNDPLEIYVEYVRWTIESYPSGGTTSESNLIPLLEESTRKFLKDKRYQQDLRYLKLWIYYSNQVLNKSARTIFNFLIHKKIGTSFSLLYLEYSQLLSIKNDDDRIKFEQILKFGISQVSNQLDKSKLINKLQEFEDSKLNPTSNIESTLEIHSAQNLTSMVNSKSKKKLKIFEDNQIDQPTELPEPCSMITRWDDIGTVITNRKQNLLERSSWKGQKLPMTPSLANPSSRPSKIKVYEDNPTDSVLESNNIHNSHELSDSLGDQNAPQMKFTSRSVSDQDLFSSLDNLNKFVTDYEILKVDPFHYHSFEES